MYNLQSKQFTGLSAGALTSGRYRETDPQATRNAKTSVAGKGRAGKMLQGMQKTQRQSFRD